MNIFIILLISFFIISIFGTLVHFTHNWFKNGLVLHFFSAVNESTWEHMKMLVAPTILVAVFQILVTDNHINILNGILALLVIEVISIPILFEIAKIFSKKVHLAITISIFYISIFLGLLCEYMVIKNVILLVPEWLALVIFCFIVACFGIFTFYTPRLGIFKDPVTGRYGHRKI
jgi:hypothetical protein